MKPIDDLTFKTNIKIGLGFGLSQFATFFCFSAMFYGAALILKDNPDVRIEDCMSAIMAIMFAGMQAGNAAAFGPDVGKATAAANRVFKIIDYPSQIDARTTVGKGRQVDRATFQGKVEFKDVWFRYPRRKEDFVLRGLNITINPNESVALVGESGCGKSTFVNLVMRFYDVDSGVVLIDDVDIKEYDLHSLRAAISMVM
jgi:ATP-binding cassette subfamily B (MDR/TAP) protein 1